jgi:hypothetical protein
MTRALSPVDVISSAALAGAAAALLVRPRHVSAIARSPLVPAAGRRAQSLARSVQRSLAPPPRQLPAGRLFRPTASPLMAAAVTQSAARRLNGSAAMLAFSVLADSAIEHYRGSFQNRAMYTPLVAAALTLGASLFGTVDRRAARHPVRDTIYGAAAVAGLAGLCFHAYNILKRPGQLSWVNLFYAAPIGAPMALALAGLLGRGAEQVRDTPHRRRATILGLPAGRMLAAVSAAGLGGTVGEAGLLHFRGAFQDPFMILPVTIPPLAAGFLSAAALVPGRIITHLARWWLRLTAFLGFAGVCFHAYGVSRNMGGWRNWSQNILNGPPLPAPPSFTGLALAGLAALALIEEERDG